MTNRDRDDFAKRIREKLVDRPFGGETNAIVAVLAELIYELRARLAAVETTVGQPPAPT